MTARTALVPTPLNRDAGSTITFNAIDVTDGNTVAAGPYKVMLIIHNTNGSNVQTLTIRATGNGVTAAGAAATGDPDYVFAQAARGDNVITIPNSSYVTVPLLDTDRVAQLDGSLSLDWAMGGGVAADVTVAVVQYPAASLGT